MSDETENIEPEALDPEEIPDESAVAAVRQRGSNEYFRAMRWKRRRSGSSTGATGFPAFSGTAGTGERGPTPSAALPISSQYA